MGAISFVLELVIAIPLGIVAATKQYSKADYIITTLALAGISLPTFFFATLLKLVFSVKLGWFDLYGLVGRNYGTLDAMGKFWDMALSLIHIFGISGFFHFPGTKKLSYNDGNGISQGNKHHIEDIV